MFDDRGRAAVWLVLGILPGVPVGLWLNVGLEHEMVLLGAVNVVGWFLLGLASGKWGSRIVGLRLCLGALGVSAFSSCASLAFRGIGATGDVVIAFIEVAFGLSIGVIGHLVSMPRDPDH